MSDELPVTDGAVDNPNPVDYEKRWKDTHANWNSLNEQMTRFKSDPNALIEFIQETHPDLLAEEDEEEDTDFSVVDDEDPVAPLNSRLDKFEQWQQQQIAKEGQALFAQDLKEVAGERTVSRQGRDWIELQVSRGSNNRAALEKATKEWFEYEDGIKGPTRKPTPTPPQPGKAAEQDYNASKDPNARRTARRARIAAQVEAGMQEQ